MTDRTVLRRNAPCRYLPTGGWPDKSSNRLQMLGQQPELIGAGRRVTKTHLDVTLKRGAEMEPIEDSGTRYRRRSEVLVYDQDRVLCVRKPHFLMLPGGGLDVGETPEQAVIRETLEEAGVRIQNVRFLGTRDSECPGHPVSKGAEGCRTELFEADFGGDWEGSHPDREEFGWLPLQDALNHLAKCLIDPDNYRFTGLIAFKIEQVAERLEKLDTPKTGGDAKIMSVHDHQEEGPLSPAVLIDLDGTVRNWDGPLTSHDPEAIRIMPNSIEILRELRSQGLRVIGVTNHTRCDGEPTPETLRECQERTIEELGGLLEDVFWSSEHDDEILKPKPTMLHEAMRRYNVDPSQSLYVGDQDFDKAAAEAAGIGFCWAEDFFDRKNVQPNTKQADVATFLPRQEQLRFSPEGKIYVRPTGHRRYEFPTGEGERVPYTYPLRFVPPQGIPEPGAVGYEYGFGTSEGDAPEGYEAHDPEEVLKGLYGGMGLSENRPYQPLDRARSQALLRALRKRRPAVPAVQAEAPAGIPPEPSAADLIGAPDAPA